MSAKCLPKLTHPAVWSLCNSWATCYYLVTGWAELCQNCVLASNCAGCCSKTPMSSYGLSVSIWQLTVMFRCIIVVGPLWSLYKGIYIYMQPIFVPRSTWFQDVSEMYIGVYRVYLTCCTGLSVSGLILLTDFYCRTSRVSVVCVNLQSFVIWLRECLPCFSGRVCYVPKCSSRLYCCCISGVWSCTLTGLVDILDHCFQPPSELDWKDLLS